MKRIGFTALLLPTLIQAQTLDVGRFDVGAAAIPAPWQIVMPNEKAPPTRYQLREWDSVAAIEATAKASMALLARPLNVDLKQFPVLCWRWRIDAPLNHADLSKKSGDDFAARVYVAFSLPDSALSFGQRLKLGLARQLFGAQVPDAAINYVWDNRHPIGFEAANAYTDHARMTVLQSGAERAGRWVEERRNIFADARRLFGTDQIKTAQLAVASDTDNTGEFAHAGFADFHFVATDQPCSFSEPSRQP